MLRISKLALVAAVTAVTIASPALAQSFNPRDGTGNALPLQYQADGDRNGWTASQPDVQVAARKGSPVQVAARASGSAQVAAHHNTAAVKIAGHRSAQHRA